MNDKDYKAFEEWLKEFDGRDEFGYEKAWKAACEYKQKEYSNLMDAMTQTSQYNFKLQAENKKLREALEQIKNLKLPDGFYDARCEIAREALKEIKE